MVALAAWALVVTILVMCCGSRSSEFFPSLVTVARKGALSFFSVTETSLFRGVVTRAVVLALFRFVEFIGVVAHVFLPLLIGEVLLICGI